jgi:transcriptional regulator with XRE-family HTH domain
MTSSDIGNRVIGIMRLIGLNQKQLSEESGIPLTTLNHIIHGRAEPGIEKIITLSKHLKVDIAWLITGEAMSSNKARSGGGMVREPGAAYEAGGLTEKIRSLSKEDQKTVEALVDHLKKRGEHGGKRS